VQYCTHPMLNSQLRTKKQPNTPMQGGRKM
jgi:hypothetical protein